VFRCFGVSVFRCFGAQGLARRSKAGGEAGRPKTGTGILKRRFGLTIQPSQPLWGNSPSPGDGRPQFSAAGFRSAGDTAQGWPRPGSWAGGCGRLARTMGVRAGREASEPARWRRAAAYPTPQKRGARQKAARDGDSLLAFDSTSRLRPFRPVRLPPVRRRGERDPKAGGRGMALAPIRKKNSTPFDTNSATGKPSLPCFAA